MASPGHPFDTKERDLIRAKHRRLLRHMDDWLVRRSLSMARELPIPTRCDAELVEDALREEIERLAGGMAVLLAPLSARQRALELRALSNESPRSLSFSADPLANWRDRVQAAAAGLPDGLPDQDVDNLLELIVLLRWADAIAADGYEDPRVTSAAAPIG